jgi:hypothetical protein
VISNFSSGRLVLAVADAFLSSESAGVGKSIIFATETQSRPQTIA